MVAKWNERGAELRKAFAAMLGEDGQCEDYDVPLIAAASIVER
jgi:hypothetical protein